MDISMSEPSSVSSSAMALRAAFGDRKLPDISRKITACVACRKLKIKCQMSERGPSCDRCRKRNLSCTVNRSLQQVLESDLSWKDSVEQRLASLEQTIASLNRVQNVNIDPIHPASSSDMTDTGNENQANDEDNAVEQNGWEVVDDGHNGPAAIPASYINEIPMKNTSQTACTDRGDHHDIVSRGILNNTDATRLFEIYRKHLDHFLYGISTHHETVEAVRRASPLLAEAIFTVAALHDRSANYAVCRHSFMKTVSGHTFSKKNTPDDVRGLCIGAFWLSDLSWPLIGLAVRIANEINLNRAFVRPRYSSTEWYTDARLYLLVHVCDRHSSIAWGRAPMSETFHDLSIFHDFLNSEHACQDDQRLISQLEIWSINYRTYKTFGLDNEGELPDGYNADFRRISIALDTWRADWQERFACTDRAEIHPRHGLSLHYNFAKLYLFSHAYRGRRILISHNPSVAIESDLDEFATNAINAAESILRTINADQEIRSNLHGSPTYFDAMIAFAVVFLLKVTASPPIGLRVNASELVGLLEDTSRSLEIVTEQMRPEHILTSIARSVKKLIDKASDTLKQQKSFSALSESMNLHSDLPWLVSPDDSIFLGNFDLTAPIHGIDLSFMDFPSSM